MDTPPPWVNGRSQWDNAIEMTKHFEGFEEKPYVDTRGNPSIGYGFNLNAYPGLKSKTSMNRAEADSYIEKIYGDAVNRAMSYSGPAWDGLNSKQRAILIDMAYNLGDKLFDFENMQSNLFKGDHEGVKREMKNSKWYKQVGRRSRHHVDNWVSPQETRIPWREGNRPEPLSVLSNIIKETQDGR